MGTTKYAKSAKGAGARLFERRLCLSHLPDGSHILVAVSGGADSIALLHVLKAQASQRRWRLTVGHLHHGIRGKMADRDAAFVKTVARALKIPCVVGRADVPVLAARDGVSIEMAARRARYAFLAKTADKVRADVVVTAHTADDQVETFFLKLCRGAGRGALGGVRAVVPLAELAPEGLALRQKVVRPLLGATRIEVLEYLRRHNMEWREDSSNTDPAFLRNRVRHELLPLLERDYNPRVRDVVCKTMEVLGAEDEWLDAMARDILARCMSGTKGVMDGLLLSSYPVAARRRVIRLWLVGQGVPEEVVDFGVVGCVDGMLSRKSGSQSLDIGMGYRVVRNYERLSVKRGGKPGAFCVRLAVPGETLIPEIGVRVEASIGEGVARARGGKPGDLPAEATVDVAVWRKRAMVVRSRKAGDRMRPFGMKGTKKVQDIMVDEGVPCGERDRVAVFECGGEIVWIPGYRIADGWAVAREKGRSLRLVVKPL